MTACRRRLRPGRWAAALAAAQPAAGWAHAFGERYDLPAPLGYFVAGAAAAVGLSFVVAALFMRPAPPAAHAPQRVVHLGPALALLRAAARTLGVVLLALVVISGLYGSRNPETNLAPVLVWIIWWVGLSFVAGLVGNVWPALDPWRTLHDGADRLARQLGCAEGLSLRWRYPRALGAWPAVFLLLFFVWLEVIHPRSALPATLAWLVLGWSAITLAGMTCFGADEWRRNADVFHRYFATLGRFAPITAGDGRNALRLRLPGSGLIDREAGSLATVGFVIAMLATVLFDGLLGTQAMLLARQFMMNALPALADPHGYLLGTAGLVAVWLVFLGAYFAACFATARSVPERSTAETARLFALTLVPIAIGYNIAHYFTYLAVHGQLVIPLLSDPLGRGWDLLGTAGYYPDIGLIDARTTWYLAISSIVVGHIVSVWLAHRVALRAFGAPRHAVAASTPLTLLMIGYTAVSLAILAEPLVQFTAAG